MNLKSIIQSKHKLAIIAGLLLVVVVLIFVLLDKEPKLRTTPVEVVYQDQEEEPVATTPMLKLNEMYADGEIPSFAGYYTDTQYPEKGVIIKIKDMNKDDIAKIQAMDTDGLFNYENADYSMYQLNDSFMVITSDLNVMALNKSVAIDDVKNRIIIKTDSSEEILTYINDEISDFDINILEFVPATEVEGN